MNNNFLSKTLKTFLTSLMVSVFVFGSFYFLLADNSETPASTPEVKKEESAVKSDKSSKLVLNDEEEIKEKIDSEETVKRVSNSEDREVLGATTNNLLSQAVIPGTGETGVVDQTTVVTSTPLQTTPTTQILVNTTNGLTATPAQIAVASGVPQTGNESLYIILGFFSLAVGFLIANGHSLAINKFEQEI